MAKIYNKIVESTTEPSKEDLWLKEGKIKKFKNGWEDISGGSNTNTGEESVDIKDVLENEWLYLSYFLRGDKVDVTKEQSDALKNIKILTIKSGQNIGDGYYIDNPGYLPLKFKFQKVILPQNHGDYTDYKCYYQWSSQETVSYMPDKTKIILGSTLNLQSNSIVLDSEQDFDFDITDLHISDENLSTYYISQASSGGGYTTYEAEDETYMYKLDNIILESLGSQGNDKGNVYFEKREVTVWDTEADENKQVKILEGKVYGLGTAAYKNVEDLQVSSVPKLRNTVSANYSDFGDAIYNGEVSKFLAKIESYGQGIEIYLQSAETGEYVNVTTLAGSSTEKTIFYLELEILMPGMGRLKVLDNNYYDNATIPWSKDLMLIEIRNGNNVKISKYY